METVVWNIARRMLAFDHPTEIVATSAFAAAGIGDADGVPVRRFNYFYPILNLSRDNRIALDRKGGSPFSFGLYRYLMSTEAPDLYHCHSMQRIANMVRLAANRRRIPYVVSFQSGYRELPQAELLEMERPVNFGFNYGGIVDFFLRNDRYLEEADGIVCIDYHDYQTAKLRFPHLPVEYFPNGVDIDRFARKSEADFRVAQGIPADRKMILCVSRIDYHKNQRILIEMMYRLVRNRENPHLVLIGPIASEFYYRQLWRDVAEFDLNERVTIIPGLRFDDPLLVASYQAADCFILPSIHEPFGIVVLEAWAAGVPVICSGAGGLRRLVRDGETGLFFNDFSCEDLLQKYYRLKHEPELAALLVEKAGQEVRKKYSWEKITDSLIKFYRRVIRHYRRMNGLPGIDPEDGTDLLPPPDHVEKNRRSR